MVEETLLKFDGERYRLLARVVMPNHVHVIVQLLPVWSMSKVLHSWKSFTANAINKLFGRTGSLWQPDYFDRYIRDGQHYDNALRYIAYNPVRERLSAKPQDWRYSSAWHRGIAL